MRSGALGPHSSTHFSVGKRGFEFLVCFLFSTCVQANSSQKKSTQYHTPHRSVSHIVPQTRSLLDSYLFSLTSTLIPAGYRAIKTRAVLLSCLTVSVCKSFASIKIMFLERGGILGFGRFSRPLWGMNGRSTEYVFTKIF